MKTYLAQFDTTKVTILATSFDDAILLLIEKDKRFYVDQTGKLRYVWTDMVHDIVGLSEVLITHGVISWESH